MNSARGYIKRLMKHTKMTQKTLDECAAWGHRVFLFLEDGKTKRFQVGDIGRLVSALHANRETMYSFFALDDVFNNDFVQELFKTKKSLRYILWRLIFLPESELRMIKDAFQKRYGFGKFSKPQMIKKKGQWVPNPNWDPDQFIKYEE